jgi:hypothetical protein
MNRLRKFLICAFSAALFLLPIEFFAMGAAQAATPLALQNGWTGGPFGTAQPAVGIDTGIVTFKGAISGGSSSVAFTLPAQFRPTVNVYVPVDMCNATKGRLIITPNGVTSVQAETSFSNAQCFTSLAGVSFAKSATSFTTLSPVNGWTNAPFGTGNAKARLIAGIVHFKGAIATTGTNSVAFTLPAALRPSTDVYVPADLCGATNGRLYIQPSGTVYVQAETSFSNAQCFTSLDGASFAKSATSFTTLSPVNGWTNAPFGTSNAKARNINGLVHLKGAISTAGNNPIAFTLPAALRPAKNSYVHIDLCNAANGRLFIQPTGVVTVQSQGSFASAQCFTSLDSAVFAH